MKKASFLQRTAFFSFAAFFSLAILASCNNAGEKTKAADSPGTTTTDTGRMKDVMPPPRKDSSDSGKGEQTPPPKM